jgi:hypothetical protein
MKSFDDIVMELSAPFPPEKIHWRIGPMTKDKTKGKPLAYIDARDVMDLLDEVVGPENWEDHYTEGPQGRVFCRLQIRGLMHTP